MTRRAGSLTVARDATQDRKRARGAALLEGGGGRGTQRWRVGTRARTRRPLAQRVADQSLSTGDERARDVDVAAAGGLVSAPTARDDARYLVRVRDLAIELGPDFDDRTLVRLVRALRSC
jgi:hypothetical protein